MRGRLPHFLTASLTDRNTPAYAGKTPRRLTSRQRLRKHPRVCGEDPDRTDRKDLAKETPPRMRGRLFLHVIDAPGKGNTPAYAGKTLSRQSAPLVKEKHPRVCGEDLTSTQYLTTRQETPPRMRGRPWGMPLVLAVFGNTPAYAGKTRSRHRASRRR